MRPASACARRRPAIDLAEDALRCPSADRRRARRRTRRTGGSPGGQPPPSNRASMTRPLPAPRSKTTSSRSSAFPLPAARNRPGRSYPTKADIATPPCAAAQTASIQLAIEHDVLDRAPVEGEGEVQRAVRRPRPSPDRKAPGSCRRARCSRGRSPARPRRRGAAERSARHPPRGRASAARAARPRSPGRRRRDRPRPSSPSPSSS